jgi:hypothetical protein
MNPWNDFNNYSGTLNLYTYDTPSEFVEQLTETIANSTYRKQNLALTRTSICPAVLIETGFISNPAEYEYFSKDENQKEMAEKIGSALEQYFYNLNDISVEGTTESTTESTTETTTTTTTATTTSSSSKSSGSSSSGGGSSSSKASSNSTTEATTEATTAAKADNVTESTTQSVLSDISGHWAESYITSAFEKGLVNGYENGSFKPNNAVTRAEFIKVLYTIFGNNDSSSSDISFADVDGNEWYCNYVKWGVANGLINGYDDNTFRANKEITREEAAVILSKCVALSDTGASVDFKDSDTVSAWAKDSVDKISKSGIMQGDNNGCFNPKKTLTRAETAVLADRIAD